MKARRSYVDGPSGQIHLQTIGTGPVILLNHQSGSSSDAFEAVMPRFVEAGFTAIAIDTPGMGRSDAPSAEVWTLDMFADAVAAVVSELGLGSVIVGGHHTGAATSLRHAILHPGQVRGLFLHQLLICDAETRAGFAANPIPPFVAKADGSHLLAGWNARCGASGDWRMVEPMNRGVLDMLRASPLVARSFAAALAYDPLDDIAAVACPVLNISNTGDHVHGSALQLRAMRPDFAYAELEGGALDIMDEQPEQWADAIVAFARGLPG